MSLHRRILAFPLALTVALAACDDLTAPRARDAAEKTERMLASGDYMQLQLGMSELFLTASYYAEPAGGGRFVPTAFVPMIRNAAKAPYRATVVERVYLPPDGSGGRPFSRFTLVAWSDPDSSRRRRLVAMFTSDSSSDVRVPSNSAVVAGAFPNTRRQSGFVMAADQADRRVWYGTDGRLVIRTGPRTGNCPYEGIRRHSSAIVELQRDTTGGLLCEERRYDASLAAFIERGDPSRRDALSRLAPLRETLRMELTTIPGVRIVTQCGGKAPLDDPMPCHDYWSFWRSNDQFAEALRVDLDAMELQPEGYVRQVIDSGRGPDYRLERGGYDVPVAYTLWSAGGRVLRESQRTTTQTDSVMQFIAHGLPQRVGARYRLVGPLFGPALIKDVRPSSSMVLDIVFLPHAPSQAREDED